MINIGERIRQVRKERGLSQGDIEGRTGLLRCYLSRVENGHTEPSLQTLARLAAAFDMPLVGFFNVPDGAVAGADGAGRDGRDGAAVIELSAEELEFLTQMRAFAGALGEQERRQVLELARKMAEGSAAKASSA